MDVGEYIRRKQRMETPKNTYTKQKESTNTMNPNEILNRYSGMSEEQLMQELFKVGSVSGGNVSASDLDNFYENVKNYLTPEQASKMKGLIMQLKLQ